MLNDTVREELALKISPLPKTVPAEVIENPTPITPAVPPVKELEISIPPALKLNNRPQTTEIMTKTTSPTLVEFNNKNATLPDWRLQLQNSVRKRLDNRQDNSAVTVAPSAPRQVNLVTRGATALKAEVEVKPEPIVPANSLLSKALERIDQSRQKYLITETAPPVAEAIVKPFPQTVQQNSLNFLPKTDREEILANQPKPNLIQFRSETQIEAKDEIKAEKFDTNKLPPIPLPAKISSSFDKKEPKRIVLEIEDDIPDIHQTKIENIHQTQAAEVVADNETETVSAEQTEEIEDLAPISLRFNAAIFDLLIGSFLSLILLSPFMMLNGRFFSWEGFIAFLATFTIVMFIYLTTTIGFLGRTFGMRIFSLEIVDIDENEYPTLHQAAVSSSVYLLSLAFGGIGFLTMLLNTEKRAAHDLLSKTIVVKEY
jgi:uncharacterized RDD family membrane protein YckC